MMLLNEGNRFHRIGFVNRLEEGALAEMVVQRAEGVVENDAVQSHRVRIDQGPCKAGSEDRPQRKRAKWPGVARVGFAGCPPLGNPALDCCNSAEKRG